MTHHTTFIIIASIIIGFCATGGALAQSESEQRPWHYGVSAENQADARALFKRGRAHHDEARFAVARDYYLQALERWDHPDIHFHLALVFQQLEQPLRVYRHIQRIHTWGKDALEPDQRTFLRDLEQTLMRDKLAVIAVQNDQPDSRISIDGVLVEHDDGQLREVVNPGRRVIEIYKVGYHPVISRLTLFPGQESTITARMSPRQRIVQPPWTLWKPWVAVGAGVALGALGVGLQVRARNVVHTAQDELLSVCDYALECQPGAGAHFNGARWQNGLGIGALIVGGLTTSMGLVAVWYNRTRIERVRDRKDNEVRTTPILAPDTVGLSLQLSY